jgi:hypothetical protein
MLEDGFWLAPDTAVEFEKRLLLASDRLIRSTTRSRSKSKISRKDELFMAVMNILS